MVAADTRLADFSPLLSPFLCLRVTVEPDLLVPVIYTDTLRRLRNRSLAYEGSRLFGICLSNRSPRAYDYRVSLAGSTRTRGQAGQFVCGFFDCCHNVCARPRREVNDFACTTLILECPSSANRCESARNRERGSCLAEFLREHETLAAAADRNGCHGY